MTKNIITKKSISLVLISLFLLTIGIYFSTQSAQNSAKVAGVQDKTTSSQTKTYTASQLSEYNGENGKACYISLDTKVYDATKIKERLKNAPSFMSQQMPKLECGKEMTMPNRRDSPSGDIASSMTEVGVLAKE